MHAEVTRPSIALGASGLEAEIALWHDLQRADNACKTASFPCQVIGTSIKLLNMACQALGKLYSQTMSVKLFRTLCTNGKILWGPNIG